MIPSNSPASLHAFISRFQLQLPQATQISHHVRPAAVLIPIVCRAEPTLLLTRPADSLRK
ncbi:CoA pyrophosphatase, partial [Serratia nematodiphila]